MKNLRSSTMSFLQRVEERSGRPIEFRPDSSLNLRATLQMARHGAPAHLLRYRATNEQLDYWVDINDPTDKSTLKALPGKYSGLRLLAIMYTAFRQIDPTMDTGADFAAEYKAALEMQSAPPNTPGA